MTKFKFKISFATDFPKLNKVRSINEKKKKKTLDIKSIIIIVKRETGEREDGGWG